MNTKYKMKDFAAEHGLTLGRHCCYGVYRDYRVHIKYTPIGNPSCLITVVTDTKGRDQDLEKFLQKNKKELKLTNYGVVGIGLMLSPQLYANVFRRIEEILDKVIRYLAKEGFPKADICPYCGTPMEDGGIAMLESGIPFYAHEQCFERAYASVKEQERRETEAPDHKPAGLGGACLAALAACLLFVLMFLWWDFAALASAASVLLGAYLYGKLGGKNTAFKVASIALVTLVFMFAVFLLCLVLQANMNAGDAVGSVFDRIAGNLRGDMEYRTKFILNLVFIVVFDLVGTGYTLFSFLRSRKKISSQMQRMD